MHGQRETSTSFKGYTIFVCGVQMVESLEIFLIFLLDVRVGEKVNGYRSLSYGGGTSDACTGDVVCAPW